MEAKTRRVQVSCCSKTHPCPTCGKLGRRKEVLTRDVRSIAFREIVILEVTYAEYRARCGCCQTFRSSPPGVDPRCWYDNKVRDAVLDRLIEDSMSIPKILAAMQRDFFLDLSQGFVYDCIGRRVAELDGADYRRWTLAKFSVRSQSDPQQLVSPRTEQHAESPSAPERGRDGRLPPQLPHVVALGAGRGSGKIRRPVSEGAVGVRLAAEFLSEDAWPGLVRTGQETVRPTALGEALEAYGRAFSLYPLRREALFGCGKVLWLQKRYPEALGMFQLAGTIPPPPADKVDCYDPGLYDGEEYFEWLFVAYYSVGDLDKAKETIAHGLRVNPLSPAFRQRSVEYGLEPRVGLNVESSRRTFDTSAGMLGGRL